LSNPEPEKAPAPTTPKAQDSEATKPEEAWLPGGTEGAATPDPQPPAEQDTAAHGTATSEWLAVPKPKPKPKQKQKPKQKPSGPNGVGSRTNRGERAEPAGTGAKQDSSRDRRSPKVPDPPSSRGLGLAGAVGQRGRLASGVRKLKTELQAQAAQVADLETELANTHSRLLEAEGATDEIRKRLDAESSATPGAGERAAERAEQPQVGRASQAEDAAAAEGRAKKREETTRRQLADAVKEIKEQLASHAESVKQQKKDASAAQRKQAAAVERLAKKLETKLAAHDERTKKREAAESDRTKKLLEAEYEAVERRLSEREETTRRQLANTVGSLTDTVESLMETVNAEVAEALKRIDRSDEGQQRQLAEAMERLTQAEEALEAGAQPVPSKPARKLAEAVELPNGKLDVNSLTFEQFRALGLTATQTSRMIALRDRVGNFSDIDQINDVVGLPARTRTMLKRRLKVG
jgi:DNA uptake protein ComE-like DNA-binding protein